MVVLTILFAQGIYLSRTGWGRTGRMGGESSSLWTSGEWAGAWFQQREEDFF